MAEPVRFGILGCARICRRGMIAAIGQAADATLLAISSSRPGTAAQWAQEFNIPRHYDSYQAVVDDPEIDAVYIPLTNELHLPWVLKAAAAGKHVLCEKPLAMNVAQAEQMAAACQRAGVLLMEAFMWRHHPRTVHLNQLVGEGELGEIRLVKMDFSFQIDEQDWRLRPEPGGGALWDLVCYGVNASRLFVGQEPNHVFARARFNELGVDRTVGVELGFPSGAIALLDGSFDCPERNRIEVVGTQGVAELPHGVLPPPEAELFLRRPNSDTRQAFPKASQYTEQVIHFCRCIRQGQLLAPAENGVANMRVLEAAMASARRQ